MTWIDQLLRRVGTVNREIARQKSPSRFDEFFPLHTQVQAVGQAQRKRARKARRRRLTA
jgi:hypothetical protein